MKKLIQTLPAVFVLGLSAQCANAAFTVSAWDFQTSWTAGSTVNIPGSVGSGITSANLEGHIGGTGSTIVQSGSGSAFTMRFDPGSSTSGAPSYFILQLSGVTSPLTEFLITYDAYIGNDNGADINTWAYSTDGNNWTDFSSVSITTTLGSKTASASNLSVSSGNIFFRNTLSGWSTSGGSGNNRDAFFDNVTVTAVPEPIHYALAAFGCIFVSVGAGRKLFARFRHT